MTARQKEMAAIKEKISKEEKKVRQLKERFEHFSKLRDSTIEDESLYSFDDFP